MCIAIVCFPGCDVILKLINFEIKLMYLIKLFSTGPKNQDKNLNILKMKKAFFKVNFFKHFSSFLQDFHLPKMVSDLSVPLKKGLNV